MRGDNRRGQIGTLSMIGERISAWGQRRVAVEAARHARQKAEDLLLSHGDRFIAKRRELIMMNWYAEGSLPPGPVSWNVDAQATMIAISGMMTKQARRHQQINLAAASLIRGGKMRATRLTPKRLFDSCRKSVSRGLGE